MLREPTVQPRLWHRGSPLYLEPCICRHAGWKQPQPEEGTIDTLTTRQRAYLKSLAHTLKPVHHIGRDGISDKAVQAVREAFNTRELLKIKVQDSAPEGTRETGQALVERLGDAFLVQVIGRTLVLYRPDPDEPAIELP